MDLLANSIVKSLFVYFSKQSYDNISRIDTEN